MSAASYWAQSAQHLPSARTGSAAGGPGQTERRHGAAGAGVAACRQGAAPRRRAVDGAAAPAATASVGRRSWSSRTAGGAVIEGGTHGACLKLLRVNASARPCSAVAAHVDTFRPERHAMVFSPPMLTHAPSMLRNPLRNSLPKPAAVSPLLA